MDFVIGLVDAAADALEVGAGIISNLFLGNDTAIDLILKWCQWLQFIKQWVEAVGNLFIPFCSGVGFRSAGASQ